ncbi:50S ribosomal protein L13 [Candidatus Dependentiae bacterium]|nr:50S ribosomal protein L13 [Candidatus Dependentiae bacterium]
MNKSFVLKNESWTPRWRLLDAQDVVLGRLATQIAEILRGKDQPHYTPHTDSGDYVVVINTDKIKFTGNKLEDKRYESYSGYIGNKKSLTAQQVMDKDSTLVIKMAVERMLPKNRLSRQLMRKLRCYKDAEHPHAAQLEGFPVK